MYVACSTQLPSRCKRVQPATRGNQTDSDVKLRLRLIRRLVGLVSCRQPMVRGYRTLSPLFLTALPCVPHGTHAAFPHCLGCNGISRNATRTRQAAAAALPSHPPLPRPAPLQPSTPPHGTPAGSHGAGCVSPIATAAPLTPPAAPPYPPTGPTACAPPRPRPVRGPQTRFRPPPPAAGPPDAARRRAPCTPGPRPPACKERAPLPRNHQQAHQPPLPLPAKNT